MSRMIICLTIPFAILFVGLSPEIIWTVPIAIGLIGILSILLINDWMDNNV